MFILIKTIEFVKKRVHLGESGGVGGPKHFRRHSFVHGDGPHQPDNRKVVPIRRVRNSRHAVLFALQFYLENFRARPAHDWSISLG